MGFGAESTNGGPELGSVPQLAEPALVSGSSTAQNHLSLLLGRLASRREDQEAWNLLYRWLRPALMAHSYRLLRGNGHLVEDAIQEVFLRIFRYSKFDKNLTDPSAFRAYVGAVSRNVASRLRLQHKNGLGAPLQSTGSNGAGPAQRARPDQQAAAREMLQKVRRQLRSGERQVFELLVEGCDLREISQKTGLAYFTAGARVCRLRARCQRFFAEV